MLISHNAWLGLPRALAFGTIALARKVIPPLYHLGKLTAFMLYCAEQSAGWLTAPRVQWNDIHLFNYAYTP